MMEQLQESFVAAASHWESSSVFQVPSITTAAALRETTVGV